jgi:hypothetical protein
MPSLQVPISPSAEPTAAPRLSWVSLTGDALRSIPRADTEVPAAEIRDVVLLGGRLIAVGSDPAGGVIWTSTDGLAWDRITSPQFDDAPLLRVVAGPGTVLAMADSGSARVLLWTSPDGRSWTEVRTHAFQPKRGLIANVLGLAYGPRGFLALGLRSYGDSETPTPPEAAWTSADGRIWREQTFSLPAGKGPVPALGAVLGSRSGYLAVGNAIWSSHDGLKWRRVIGLGKDERLSYVTHAGSRIFAVGRGANAPIAFVSSDGRTWRRSRVNAGSDYVIAGVTATSTGYVAVGTKRTIVDAGTGRSTQWPAIWRSNTGDEWNLEEESSVAGPGAMNTATQIEGRIVALGSRADGMGDAEFAGVWVEPPVPETASGLKREPTPFPGVWASLPELSLPELRYGAKPYEITPFATTYKQRVVVLYEEGADTEGADRTGILWFDPATRVTEVGPSIPIIHGGPITVRVGDRLLLMGGFSAPATRRIDAFDLRLNRWEAPRRLTGELAYSSGSVMTDGRVLAINSDAGDYRIVDPQSGRATKPKLLPFLPTGYIVNRPDGTALALSASRVWVYDPRRDHWMSRATAPRIGGNLLATALPDGSLLAIRWSSVVEQPRAWIERISDAGRAWFEWSSPLDGAGASSLVPLDSRSVLAVTVKEPVCEENCPVPEQLEVRRLDFQLP